MAPAAVQGFAAHRSRKPYDFDPQQAKLILKFLINTCHAWREDGPFVQSHKEMLQKALKL
jgi:hypothetical protein